MAKIALIQDLYPVLNEKHPERLTGFTKQVYEQFFEVLVAESGHEIQNAETLAEYQAQNFDQPDLIICAPFPEVGNLAPGFAELGRIRTSYPSVPVVVWSNRTENVIRATVIDDQGAAAFYTGTLLEAPDDIADMVLEYVK